MIQEFDDVKRILRIADHMVYVTYPVLKENRLLIKVLDEIYAAVSRTFDVLLKKEYEFKRIKIYSDNKINMAVFEQRCASRYNLTNENMAGIKHIMALHEYHKSSPIEFVRQNNFIMMSDNLQTESITLQKLKILLAIAKEFIKKAEFGLSSERINIQGA